MVPVVIDISAVKRKDASSCQVEASFFLCLRYFVYSPLCHTHYFGNIAPIVEENMNLECSLGSSILCPRKYSETEIDDRCIQRVERILKGELLVWIVSESCNALYLFQERVEELLVDLVGSMIVRIRKSGFCDRLNPEVIPFILMKR